MMKVTHICRNDEDKVAERIAKFLHKTYPHYFEVRVYADGVNKMPTLVFARDRPSKE